MINKDDILNLLRQVNDPELGVNIVDLGLVYNVVTDNDSINVTMTLTSPACPLNAYIQDQAETAIKKEFPNIKSVKIELVHNPPWKPSMMSETAKKILGW